MSFPPFSQGCCECCADIICKSDLLYPWALAARRLTFSLIFRLPVRDVLLVAVCAVNLILYLLYCKIAAKLYIHTPNTNQHTTLSYCTSAFRDEGDRRCANFEPLLIDPYF